MVERNEKNKVVTHMAEASPSFDTVRELFHRRSVCFSECSPSNNKLLNPAKISLSLMSIASIKKNKLYSSQLSVAQTWIISVKPDGDIEEVYPSSGFEPGCQVSCRKEYEELLVSGRGALGSFDIPFSALCDSLGHSSREAPKEVHEVVCDAP